MHSWVIEDDFEDYFHLLSYSYFHRLPSWSDTRTKSLGRLVFNWYRLIKCNNLENAFREGNFPGKIHDFRFFPGSFPGKPMIFRFSREISRGNHENAFTVHTWLIFLVWNQLITNRPKVQNTGLCECVVTFSNFQQFVSSVNQYYWFRHENGPGFFEEVVHTLLLLVLYHNTW